MAASAARALLLSRFSDLSLKSSSLSSRHHFLRPFLISSTKKPSPSLSSSSSPSPSSSVILNCLFSGIDGGGVADDFVSTRKSGYDREFSVIANMLKRIEPLDTSTISKGVSDTARDSMKRTISSMLGLLPSDQFSVTIRVSRSPLLRLLSNSIITGYTLWNAEYRVSLTRNLDLSPDIGETAVSSPMQGLFENECEEKQRSEVLGEIRIPLDLRDLSPEALSYIQELKSELEVIEKEMNAQKQENLRMGCDREDNNDLLKYLRSLHPDIVNELSLPSSLEVEDIIHQLVDNVMQRLFKDDSASGFLEDSEVAKAERPDGDLELFDTIGTSRDYLAQLLFWCMLLGHHLRGLEYRLHLSCVVGLL